MLPFELLPEHCSLQLAQQSGDPAHAEQRYWACATALAANLETVARADVNYGAESETVARIQKLLEESDDGAKNDDCEEMNPRFDNSGDVRASAFLVGMGQRATIPVTVQNEDFSLTLSVAGGHA